jgi:protein-disulfide isomerase
LLAAVAPVYYRTPPQQGAITVAAPTTPPEQPTRSWTPFYVLLGVIALLGLGLIAAQLVRHRARPATEPVPGLQGPAAAEAEGLGIAMGRPDAPVVLYEFADFQCPGCAAWAAFMTPVIKERLVDTGRLRYVYFDFPLVSIHRHAFLAARAGRCAHEQGRFWPYHDVLYGRQREWADERDPTDRFVEYARLVGLDAGGFERCLRSDRYAAEVTRSLRFGESLGVDRTPTIFLNGRKLTDLPTYSQLEALVREASGGRSPADTGAAARR